MPKVVKPLHFKSKELTRVFSAGDPTMIFGDLRQIGCGSFGAVYYAEDLSNGNVVAIKEIKVDGKHKKSDKEDWEDILQEIQILSQISHENCIQYYGAYLKDQNPWLILEYCLGSVADILEVHKEPLLSKEISSIVNGVLHGLVYLHSAGFIHRDIKASNILLTENGIVKIGDFGSASLVCPANSFVGTPFWIAPEVILAMENGLYDEKADIWSLGITCIEMVMMEPPFFRSLNPMAAMYQIASSPSPTLTASTDQSLVAFVDCLLQKEPSDRPSAAAALSLPFCAQLRPPSTLFELIQRTKLAVALRESQISHKLKKMIISHKNLDSLESQSMQDISAHSIYQRMSPANISKVSTSLKDNKFSTPRALGNGKREASVVSEIVEDQTPNSGAHSRFSQGDSSSDRSHLSHALSNIYDNLPVSESISSLSNDFYQDRVLQSDKGYISHHENDPGSASNTGSFSSLAAMSPTTSITNKCVLPQQENFSVPQRSGSERTTHSRNVPTSQVNNKASSSIVPVDDRVLSYTAFRPQSTVISSSSSFIDQSASLEAKPIAPQEGTTVHHVQTVRSTGGKGHFATLKTTKMMRGIDQNESTDMLDEIGRELLESERLKVTAVWREQMNNLKRLRASHQKQLKQLEDKNKAEMDALRIALNKELETIKTAQSKELDKTSEKFGAEIDKIKKHALSKEAKLRKQLDIDTKSEVKSAKKTLKQQKSDASTSANSSSLGLQEVLVRRNEMNAIELRRFKRQFLLELQQDQKNHLEDMSKLREKHMDKRNAFELCRHDKILNQEFGAQEKLHRLRVEQIKKQHDLEMENQLAFATQQRNRLTKKHTAQTKSLPKHLKEKEGQIRKQFKDAVRIQKKQFQTLREIRIKELKNDRESMGSDSLNCSSKESLVLSHLKEEEKRKENEMELQYEASIRELYKRQNVKVDSTQSRETTECHSRLEADKKLLADYQEKQRLAIVDMHNRERMALQEAVQRRKIELEASIEASLTEHKEESRSRIRCLFEKHASELRDFDVETKRIGLDTFKIANVATRILASALDSPATSSTPVISTPRRAPAEWRHSRADFYS